MPAGEYPWGALPGGVQQGEGGVPQQWLPQHIAASGGQQGICDWGLGRPQQPQGTCNLASSL